MENIAIVGVNVDIPGIKKRELGKIIKNGICVTNFKQVNSKLINQNSQNFLDQFDNEFFEINKKEAISLSVCHRILIENIWAMLDSFGLLNENLSETGVYSAITPNYNGEEYANYSDYINKLPDTVATRIAYTFDFHGMSANYASACSSSMIALKNAINALDSGKIKMAIVCSANILQNLDYEYTEGSIFSKSGKCSPFSTDADGMVPGNGAVSIALKLLKNAENDNDNILGVIRGIGTSNDGCRKPSFTSPSVEGERDAIKNAYFDIQELKNKVDYVEAHGTGTQIGDAIETEAIRKEFHKNICIGSSKANFGHLNCAAGLISLVKVIYMLNQQIIPKQANFLSLNSLLKDVFVNKNIKNTNLDVIGINSFGIGGTNSHLVVQKYELQRPTPCIKNEETFNIPISTKREKSLEGLKREVKEVIGKLSNLSEIYSLLRTYIYNKKIYDNIEWIKVKIFKGKVVDIVDKKEKYNLNYEREKNKFLLSYPKAITPTEKFYNHELYKKDIGSDGIYSVLQDYTRFSEEELRNMRINNLGLESLDIVELLSKLNKVFNKNIDLSTFYKYLDMPIKDVNSIFLKNMDKDTFNSEFMDMTGQQIIDKYGEIGILKALNEVNENKYIRDDIFINSKLTLKEYLTKNKEKKYFISYLNGYNPNRKNLFLVHPAGGTTFGYKNFFDVSYIDFNIILIGFPFKEIDFLEEFTLHQLAKYYLKIITKINKDNDFYIGGYSFGGNVSFEIAKILKENKNNNVRLILIDSYQPYTYFAPEKVVTANAEKVIMQEINKNINLRGISENQKKLFNKVWGINHLMLKRYIPEDKKLDCDVLLLICTEKENKDVLESLYMKDIPKESWQHFFKKKIKISKIPGNHFSIYGNKGIGKNVGDKIARYINN